MVGIQGLDPLPPGSRFSPRRSRNCCSLTGSPGLMAWNKLIFHSLPIAHARIAG